ncbi:MAG: two-component regulator propeller domain-containing protein, partial [Fidelibacterota bacterium]
MITRFIRTVVGNVATVVAVCSTLGYAQPQTLKFDRLSIDEGLSNSYVTCILQDIKGFMWFGTQDGLNKYDGY